MTIDDLNNDASEIPVPNEHQEYLPPLDPTPIVETPEQNVWQQNRLDLSKVSDTVEKVKNELKKIIIGQEEMMDLLLAALFSGGHVLLEGVPGIAKTLSAKLLAQSINTAFNRIQFTPDLMPTDVVGSILFSLIAACVET